MSARHRGDARGREDGQALVEFSLAIIPFLLLVIGLFDIGRAVYTYNGLAEATREIARVTAVHPGIVLGSSTQTADRVAVQRGLVPNMGSPTFTCTDITGTANGHIPCRSGDYVQVSLSSIYSPVAFLGLAGPITLNASAFIRIP